MEQTCCTERERRQVTMVTCKVMNMLLKKLMAATNACKQTQTIREECFDCHTVFIHTQRQVLSHTQKNKIHWIIVTPDVILNL